MVSIRLIFSLILLLWALPAAAQCGAQFTGGQVCGLPPGSPQGQPGPYALGQFTTNFAASAPLSVSFPGNIVTYALNYNSSLLVDGGNNLSINLAHTNIWTVAQIINLNASSLQSAQVGTILQLGGANGIVGRLEIDTYGATAHFTGVRADGTAASPTPLLSGDNIASFNAFGYDGSAFVGPQAALRCYARQNWVHTSALGTYCNIATTPNGSTTLTQAMYVGAGVVVGPNTTDPGIGSLLITSQTGAIAAAPAPGLQIVGVNSAFNFITLDTFGATSGGYNAIVGRAAGGTFASPSATPANANLMTYGAHGWDTAWEAVTSGELQIKSINQHSVSDHSTQLLFWATPSGSTTIALASTFWATNVAFGPSAPSSNVGFWINQNANSAHTITAAGTAFQIDGPDSVTNVVGLNSYGAGTVLVAMRTQGTAASPTGLVAGAVIMTIAAQGWTSAGAISANYGADIKFIAEETWSGTANGGEIAFFSTPLTTTTPIQAMTLLPSGGLGIGAITDPGAGGLYVNAHVFFNGLTAGSGSAALCLNATGNQVESDTSGTICGISIEAAKNLFPRDRWITPTAALAAVMTWRAAVPYRYKDGRGDEGGLIHVSLMADDVARTNPNCGDYGGPGGELSNYSDRCVEAYAVASIQAIRTADDDRDSKIAALQAANDNLKTVLLDLRQRAR